MLPVAWHFLVPFRSPVPRYRPKFQIEASNVGNTFKVHIGLYEKDSLKGTLQFRPTAVISGVYGFQVKKAMRRLEKWWNNHLDRQAQVDAIAKKANTREVRVS